MEVSSVEMAKQIAIELALKEGFNEEKVEAFAESWYDSGLSYNECFDRDLKTLIKRRFGQ